MNEPSLSALIPQSLHAQSAPLAGLQLIEASAGTGKTWSIAALYLRMVLELALPVEKILVVTYTTAATAELKTRIRERLVQALAVFRGDVVSSVASSAINSDAVLDELRRNVAPDRAQALLVLAIESFDLAAIYTIHGFCQRALAERAFESGEPFELNLLTDDGPLLRDVAQDLWRCEMDSTDAAWLQWLAGKIAGPDALLNALRASLGKPWLAAHLPPDWDSHAESAWLAQRGEFAALWQQQAETVCQMLNQAELNQQSYKPAQIDKAARVLDAWLGEASSLPGKDENSALELFSQGKINSKTKKGGTPPEHPLFILAEQVLDSAKALNQARERRLGAFLHQALQSLESRWRKRKGELASLSFDDLLNRVHGALHNEGGDLLAAALQARFGAALIDEFQDTDPTQFAIFDRVFRAGGLPLFLVGDPKQAIYSFRGADLQAYLGARDVAQGAWMLGTNRRSTASLVAAVNALFQRQEAAFIDQRLHFAPVAASAMPPGALQITDAAHADLAQPCTLWFVPREAEINKPDKPVKVVSKEKATSLIVNAVAAEIAQLLRLGSEGKATLPDKTGVYHVVSGGDIAVLVRGHFQGKRMAEALAALNIASIRYGQDSVFASRECLALERLLRAVAEPGREGLVKAALATDLLGLDGAQIFALQSNPTAWDERLASFHRWHLLCRDHGFITLWRCLLVDEGIAARLLAWPDGERRMTNVQHLAELLQQWAHDHGMGAEALADRLADEREGSQQRASASGDPTDGEARLLRLESDEHLVKILTVHASKGLEFPIVYCPFLWDGAAGGKKNNKVAPLRFHDAEGEPGLDFGSVDIENNRAQAERERREELLRLAYVALTRAQQRCVIAWGAINGADSSALAWLLHGAEPADFLSRSDAELQTDLANLAQTCSAITVQTLPDEPGQSWLAPAGAAIDPHSLRARRFQGRVDHGWRSHSFSGWLAASQQHDVVDAPAADLGATQSNELPTELPDHDGLLNEAVTEFANELESELESENPAATLAPAVQRGLFDTQSNVETRTVSGFPRGSNAGSALHAVMERVNFATFEVANTADKAALTPVLATYALGEEWTEEAARLVMATLDAPLPGLTCDFSLRQLDPARLLPELEFLFPIALPDMAQLARAIGPNEGAQGSLAARVGAMKAPALRGFLKGFIDLVFEHEGRLCLLDYKSNWLGGALDDYRPEALEQAMAAENYDLQALLYTVALHRLLKLRRADYDYEQHMGAAYYLFLRGLPMPGMGVHLWRPAAALVARVDACLSRMERLFE